MLKDEFEDDFEDDIDRLLIRNGSLVDKIVRKLTSIYERSQRSEDYQTESEGQLSDVENIQD